MSLIPKVGWNLPAWLVSTNPWPHETVTRCQANRETKATKIFKIAHLNAKVHYSPPLNVGGEGFKNFFLQLQFITIPKLAILGEFPTPYVSTRTPYNWREESSCLNFRHFEYRTKFLFILNQKRSKFLVPKF